MCYNIKTLWNQNKFMPYKDKDKQNEYSRNWSKSEKGKSSIRLTSKERYSRNRTEVFEILGNKCSKCGFSDKRALQIDHINGDAIADKKIRNKNCYHAKVIESLKNKENKYQILCANCNWIKRVENNEHKPYAKRK